MIIKKDPDIIKSYLEDSSNIRGGRADIVAVPESVEELASFLKEANNSRTKVTVSGGGTSTTGSRVPLGGAVVSLEKLNRIIGISRSGSSATVQAGVFVDELKKASERVGLFYTCHPTEGSAMVGGTLATNASGARSFKYGPTRKYVNRLKMILATGEMLDVARGEKTLKLGNNKIIVQGRAIDIPLPAYKMPNVKNAAGYFAKDGMDLVDLLIGHEGTLGVIVEAEIALVKRPEKILSAFAFFRKEEDAWSFASDLCGASRTRKPDGAIDALSIEYFDVNALGLLGRKSPNVPPGAAAAIFIEQEVARGREGSVIEEWLRLISSRNGSADDTWVAMTEKEAAVFNSFRYSIPESVNDIVRKNGFQKLSADIAVPEDEFYGMMKFYQEALKDSAMSRVIFGHIGECHVHANILPKSAVELAAAKGIIMSFVRKGVSLGGTVSAEHGIGKIKHQYLEVMYGPSGVLEMARVKKAFDPNCILNLDNVFPKELLAEI